MVCIFAIGLNVGGCHSAASCERASDCPTDTVPPWGSAQTCQFRLSGSCGYAWAPLLDCMQNNQVCTSGGYTDVNAVNCGDLAYEYTLCCEGPDASAYGKGCSGGP